MIEFYLQTKAVHVACVLSSGALFLLRAVLVQLGAGWGSAAPVRYLSYSIDTVLLTSALMLMTALHQFPFVQSWLTVKVLLVVIYIVLGSFALKRGRTQRVRLACAGGAILVYGMVISVALTHHPLGAITWITR
jgi:uncharacterized membrane protein SirB2